MQLRPDHDIDYYILCVYNLYYDTYKGKGFIFKIPSDIICDLIVRFGGHAHGTIKMLGKITKQNIKGRNCEYALRCNPNARKGKSHNLWNILLEYEVEYHPDNF